MELMWSDVAFNLETHRDVSQFANKVQPVAVYASHSLHCITIMMIKLMTTN